MKLKRWRWLSVLTTLLLILSSCLHQADRSNSNIIQVWAHAGPEGERQVIEQQIAQFNEGQADTTLDITFLPAGTYNAQVQAAAISGDLPDVLEFDGPFVYNYVWQQNLIPIDDLLSSDVRNDLLPSIINQGTYNDRLYSVGTFDSGLGMYGDRRQLDTAGIRIPTSTDDAWTAAEFQDALVALSANDDDGQVLDLKLNYRGEWFTYGFSPILQSAGGDLINRDGYQSATGKLNGEGAIAAITQLQSWLEDGYVDPNIDDAAFTSRRVALSWVGHWMYPGYAEALGDDLVLLPLPNFGQGSKTGQGSWNWGITSNCQKPEVAIAFLEFILQPDQVLAMSEASGAVPGTKRAIAQSALYAEDGPLGLFSAQLLKGQTVPRPQTPAYPVITSVFQQAFNDIRHGTDVKTALDNAAIEINQDIEDNQGYPTS